MHKSTCIWIAIGTFWGVVIIASAGYALGNPDAGKFLASVFFGIVVGWAVNKHRTTLARRLAREESARQEELAVQEWRQNGYPTSAA